MIRGIDYIGITCVFFCHDGKGNILLHKRSEKCKDEQGNWDCGGGALEFGEEFDQGVR
jgi:8-oxo-dGTP diphosphatase